VRVQISHPNRTAGNSYFCTCRPLCVQEANGRTNDFQSIGRRHLSNVLS